MREEWAESIFAFIICCFNKRDVIDAEITFFNYIFRKLEGFWVGFVNLTDFVVAVI